jgi:hypothetical protein
MGQLFELEREERLYGCGEIYVARYTPFKGRLHSYSPLNFVQNQWQNMFTEEHPSPNRC